MLSIYFESVYVKLTARRSETKMETHKIHFCSPLDLVMKLESIGTESFVGKLTYLNSPNDTHYLKLLYTSLCFQQ